MIQTEVTPNPDSLKFLSEKTISAIGTEEFQKVAECVTCLVEASPL